MAPKMRKVKRSKAQKRAIADRLRAMRGERSQDEWSQEIRSAQQTVSKYEAGKIPTSWLLLARLHEREGVDLNDLLTGNGK